MGLGELVVGTASAQPGQKVRGWVKVGTRAGDAPLAIPVIVINGSKEGPIFCVDAGVHGDEHEGMVAVLELAKRVQPEELAGALILVPCVNTPAFEAMRRGNPEDAYIWDLNRCYPGSPTGFLTQRIADAHFNQIVSKANYSISLHCGANYFYLIGKVLYEDEGSKELAKSFGKDWQYLWEGTSFNQTLKNACISKGIGAVTVELGGNGNRLPHEFTKNVNTMVSGVLNSLRHFGALSGQAEYPEEWIILDEKQPTADFAGLLTTDPGMELGERVTEGTTVMRIRNFYGDEVQEIKMPYDGLLMGLRTYPAVHTGDWTSFLARVKRVENRRDFSRTEA